MNPKPSAFYQSRLTELEAELRLLKQRQSRLGWLRLAIVLLTLIGGYGLYTVIGTATWAFVAGGLGVFLWSVSRDADNSKVLQRCKILIGLNESELAVLNYRFSHLPDGAAFSPASHSYAGDLDLFGPASLYQYLNRCQTEGGQNLLAQNLLTALPVTDIRNRQAAVKDLSPAVVARQEFAARATIAALTTETERRLGAWLTQPGTHYSGNGWKVFLALYTTGTLLSLVAAIAGWMPVSLFSFLTVLYFGFSLFLSRRVMQPYLLLSGIAGQIKTVSALTGWIEAQSFSAPHLQALQQPFREKGASRQSRKLQEILARMDLRLNAFVFFFLNSFLLWDVRQLRALQEWKKENHELLPYSFTAIAEMEVCQSLAALHYNQPEWVFPNLAAFFHFEGREVGHPLLANNVRVTSSFTLTGKGQVALVTGSNMAGKSTFLRSLGVNSVLAFTGAPVCAQALTLAPFHLMSSMRIADNLAESTSTFYAELKKLAGIIQAVKAHQPVFILLDEILRGTNSLDRHLGTQALIRQLIREGAVAVLATHDVELATLAGDYPGAVTNYHFDVQVSGEELYFDYLLKPGVCQSLNASLLMKKIGIEL